MAIDKPSGIKKPAPLDEIRNDLSGHKGAVIGAIFFSFILGDFISGFLYNIWMDLLDKRWKFGLLNSFVYGISNMLIVTILLSLIFAFACFRLYRMLKKNYKMNYDDNMLESDKETYGGAHFQTDDELEENFTITDSIDETDGDVFGEDEDGRIYTFNYPPGMNMNKLYFGAPGSGKSAAIIKTAIYQNIRQGNSIICTDSKGDLYKETARVCKKYGYRVKALMLKPEWFRNSDAFNMFVNLDPDDADLDSKADVIANVIIKNTSGDRESTDYWGKNEFNLIKCLIMYVSTMPEYIREGRNNLPEIYNFLTTYDAKGMEGIFLNISKASPIRQCYDIFANCNEQNRGQIINGAAIRLAKLTNKYLQKALSFNEMDLVDPMKKKCIYYVIISDTDDAYKFIASLFFSSIFNMQCAYSDNLSKAEKKEQLSVQYLCDEYFATGGIQGLPIKISTMRSRKIGITIILQNKGQLESMYEPGEVETILNACTVKALLSTNDTNTAEYFSTLLGTKTVLVENLRYMENADDVIHAHDTIQKTLGEGNRALMLPEELMNGKLNRNELIYVISGMAPVRLRKYFAEKGGEAIHPMEKEAQSLGEQECKKHRPKWRKRMEEQEAAAQAAMESYSQESMAQTEVVETYEEDSSADNSMGGYSADVSASPPVAVSAPTVAPQGHGYAPISKTDVTQKAPNRPQNAPEGSNRPEKVKSDDPSVKTLQKAQNGAQETQSGNAAAVHAAPQQEKPKKQKQKYMLDDWD